MDVMLKALTGLCKSKLKMMLIQPVTPVSNWEFRLKKTKKTQSLQDLSNRLK